MNILAIDTSTDACSAALLAGGELYQRCQIAPRQHTELILPMIDSVLAEAGLGVRQLDGLAFGRGPGAFTGVRVASSVIQGIAYGCDLPVAAVSTLAALAQQAWRSHGAIQVLAGLDARLQQVYWGQYVLGAQQCMQLQGGEQVCLPAAVPRPTTSGWLGAGSAWLQYRTLLTQQLGDCCQDCIADIYPQARDVALLGQRLLQQGLGVAADRVLPVYLRDQVASKPASSDR
ncbi:MAG: tRNA (adenosine(37)-N6)-threonylcarbamoyltransferase complex dimerization subunit type 1 TsaB [Gammaproteobacteria bacterium]|nr:tRNA (adenosine(37)-N6)-threonylcarbamoyltransferase complex dimerization subunit type 1 TsaB [Gammaproteobacteria bacterium]